MYISLYPAKQLEKAKERMLWLGLFMLSGGLAALLNDIVMRNETRWDWAAAAFLIGLTGVLLVAMGTDRVQLNEAYFSITPARVSYRLHLLSHERMIYWQQIASVQVTERYVLFDLTGGRQVILWLNSFRSDNAASHVATSVQVAALEHHVAVNGVKFSPN